MSHEDQKNETIDDIIERCYKDEIETHKRHVAQVLKRLKNASLQIKIFKVLIFILIHMVIYYYVELENLSLIYRSNT